MMDFVEVIQAIKGSYSKQIFSYYGYDNTRKKYTALEPSSHNNADLHPSMGLHQSGDTFYLKDFAGSQKKYSSVDLIMICEGLGFADAVRRGAEICGIEIDSERQQGGFTTNMKYIISGLYRKAKQEGFSVQAIIGKYHYLYKDAKGKKLFDKYRIDYINESGKREKYIIQGIEKNGYVTLGLKGLDQTKLTAYGAFRRFKPGEKVYIPEGEKCVDSCINAGLKNTFTLGSSGDFKARAKGLRQLLYGVDVIILQDNDNGGEAATKALTDALDGVAASIKVVVPDKSRDKADIADFFCSGGTLPQLEKMIAETPCYTTFTQSTQPAFAYNDNGKILQSIGNCIIAIQTDTKLKQMLRYNAMTSKTEVSGAWWYKTSTNITDNDENNIRLYLETTYGLTHEKNIPRAIDIVAHQNTYHPIKQYLDNLQWDGMQRIGDFLPRYLGAQRSAYTTAATQLTLLGAINRIYNPGTKFDTMLCLVEDKQGSGKSAITRLLAANDDWYTDDIKNLDDENVYRKLQGHWIIEMSEMLATINTKTVEAIKSFLSRQKDTYKVPYDRYPLDFPRQCIFIGTTNNLDFLPNDKTGNRRFIPVRVHGEAAEIHPLQDEAATRSYIDQLWAEAMTIYRSEDYSLTFPADLGSELLDMQQAFTPEDSKTGIIQEWLDNCKYKSVCSIMIYKEALKQEYQEPKEWELREISNIMNKSITGWKKHPTSDAKVRFVGYGKQRAWDKIVCDTVPNNLSPGDFKQLDLEQVKEIVPFDK